MKEFTIGHNDAGQRLDRFLAKIKTPVDGWKRKLTRLKGRFIITNFSGNRNEEIHR